MDSVTTTRSFSRPSSATWARGSGRRTTPFGRRPGTERLMMLACQPRDRGPQAAGRDRSSARSGGVLELVFVNASSPTAIHATALFSCDQISGTGSARVSCHLISVERTRDEFDIDHVWRVLYVEVLLGRVPSPEVGAVGIRTEPRDTHRLPRRHSEERRGATGRDQPRGNGRPDRDER